MTRDLVIERHFNVLRHDFYQSKNDMACPACEPDKWHIISEAIPECNHDVLLGYGIVTPTGENVMFYCAYDEELGFVIPDTAPQNVHITHWRIVQETNIYTEACKKWCKEDLECALEEWENEELIYFKDKMHSIIPGKEERLTNLEMAAGWLVINSLIEELGQKIKCAYGIRCNYENLMNTEEKQ